MNVIVRIVRNDFERRRSSFNVIVNVIVRIVRDSERHRSTIFAGGGGNVLGPYCGHSHDPWCMRACVRVRACVHARHYMKYRLSQNPWKKTGFFPGVFQGLFQGFFIE